MPFPSQSLPSPSLLLARPPSRLAPPARLMAAAAIACGFLIGNWVLGPAVSEDVIDHPRLRSAKAERAAIDALSARPDPSPYRTPTPKFDVPDAPRYGELARQQARAELDRRQAGAFDDARDAFAYPWGPAGDASGFEAQRRTWQPSRRVDRHTGVAY